MLFYVRFGGRFFALNDCYDRKWRNLAKEVGEEMGIQSRLHEGVYTMLGGPNFETVAEIRMLKICGVDAVGTSYIFLVYICCCKDGFERIWHTNEVKN